MSNPVGEEDDSYPWEAEEAAHDQYLEHLAFLHLDHMYYYNRGICSTLTFWPETIDDVYNNNLFAISWFYHGCFDCETWEAKYEEILYREAEMRRIDVEEPFDY